MASDPTDRPPTYEIDTLYPGCKILTPLSRWETVISIRDIDGVRRHVVTDRCVGGCGWTVPRWREYEAILPRAEQYSPEPELRMVDLNHTSTPHMIVVPTTAQIEIPDFGAAMIEAVYLGHGRGWEVTERDGGGSLVAVPRSSKATARTFVRQAGRNHARGLGVRYCEHEGRHHHQEVTSNART
jgi:hypothetical protein